MQRSYEWVNFPDNESTIQTLRQMSMMRILSKSETPLDQGRVQYNYLVQPNLGQPVPNIQPKTQVPITFSILESKIRSVPLDSDRTYSDVVGAIPKTIAKMVEHLLHVSVFNVETNTEFTDNDRLLIYTPIINVNEQPFMLYRTPEQAQWLNTQVPLDLLVGWQPISADLAYIVASQELPPMDPNMLQVRSGMLFTKVGRYPNEYIQQLELNVRSMNTNRHHLVLTSDPHRVDILEQLANILESPIKVWNTNSLVSSIDENTHRERIVAIQVPEIVGFSPKFWVESNIPRLSLGLLPIVQEVLEDKPMSTELINKIYRETFPDRDGLPIVLPDGSILYEIESINDIHDFKQRLAEETK